ncbi:MAG: flagellar biosynthesis protein FlgL [Sulfuricurvum sp.]|uniref:flagellin N-terminal helical domain-containing protein n=1 Tax=Sulfuricurvum sp. TaxID=2025608 RepID=UPI002605F41A|nr:flagellar biosynthesis protein FlgL [Sulfuricurvum sp.]MDD2829094.1 flagellar biosynthesis protein FlgL [Sulfuricurvum sp.]MDD4948842.1 flagellar biosynthesis protein FlgL [Sulfuricurvum sp.]
MRVTSSSYYNNIYGENNKLNQQLFDVNKQISSTQKIQYSYEDPNISTNTLRLDDEITTLTQTKSSAQNAFKMSTQTDTTIGDIVKTMESMKVKLVNAANSTQSDASIQAIAKELRGLQNHLMTLANTSIGGQYLFSGTASSQKPIDDHGVYQGNNKDQLAFLGSGVKQKYNISGAQLFLGEESKINRTITTNIVQPNLTDLYKNDKNTYITSANSIGDLMGNTVANSSSDSYFYIQGSKTDGSTFKKQIQLTATDTMDDLLKEISNTYGTNKVNVTLNPHGQIEISDKTMGSSKLDFHMVAAIDFSGGTAATNAITDITTLQAGSTDFQTAGITTPGLYVKEFTKSGFNPTNTLDTIEGINYDQTQFTQKGAELLSNVAQIVRSDNTYATPATKIVDVGSFSTNTTIHLEGTTITGAAFSQNLNLATDLLDENGNPTALNDVTYQQVMDAINVIVTGASTTQASYALGTTSLSYDGKITFKDKTNATTQASLSIYDSTSSDYTTTTGSALTFNANNALTVRDPKNDFFTQIDQIIKSVEEGKTRANGSDTTDPRNIGIQNSIQMIDDINDHVGRLQTESGSYSQVLQSSSDRSDLLITSTKMLRSDVIDTDIAESQLKLQQLSLSYQAMLSTISKVSKLSLVNYL